LSIRIGSPKFSQQRLPQDDQTYAVLTLLFQVGDAFCLTQIKFANVPLRAIAKRV